MHHVPELYMRISLINDMYSFRRIDCYILSFLIHILSILFNAAVVFFFRCLQLHLAETLIFLQFSKSFFLILNFNSPSILQLYSGPFYFFSNTVSSVFVSFTFRFSFPNILLTLCCSSSFFPMS